MYGKRYLMILKSTDFSQCFIREQRAVREVLNLMEGVFPHVSACQRLIKRENYRIVFGIRLVTSLPDPAVVVGQRMVKAPEKETKANETHARTHTRLIQERMGSEIRVCYPQWMYLTFIIPPSDVLNCCHEDPFTDVTETCTSVTTEAQCNVCKVFKMFGLQLKLH